MTKPQLLDEIESAMSPTGKLFRQVSLEFFREHIPPGSRVLDCGAGDGAVAIPLAAHGCAVDAIDFQPERIANLDASKGDLAVRGIAGDFFTYPFEPVYDYVIARQFVAHFPDRWRDVVKRMSSLCKPGGAVIFHIHASESAAHAAEIAASTKHRAAVERGYPKNGSASRAELEEFARANGLAVERVCPITFLHPKALFWRAGFDKDQRVAFGEELERRLSRPEIFEFARWLEAEIVGGMPLGFAASFLAILRK